MIFPSRLNFLFADAPTINPVDLLPLFVDRVIQSLVVDALQIPLVSTTIKLASFSEVKLMFNDEISKKSTTTGGFDGSAVGESSLPHEESRRMKSVMKVSFGFIRFCFIGQTLITLLC